MIWPLTTTDETLVLAVTAPPTEFQVAPASLEKITPAAGPSIPALENCPKPARMRLGLLGSRAMPPMDREVRCVSQGRPGAAAVRGLPDAAVHRTGVHGVVIVGVDEQGLDGPDHGIVGGNHHIPAEYGAWPLGLPGNSRCLSPTKKSGR